MLDNYNHKFTLPKGHQVFVPSWRSRRDGALIQRLVHRRWRTPSYFYHLRSGGHVAAARRHLSSTIFVRLDISRFYDSITRAKIHRALRVLGVDHAAAWNIARESTVEKTSGAGDFSVPYGFVQSPILSSIALDRSALGRAMKGINSGRSGVLISDFVDDVILSGTALSAVEDARSALIDAAYTSGFEFNSKAEGPAPEITVFNLVLSNGTLVVSDAKMAEFEVEVRKGDPAVSTGIITYVWTVNPAQADYLRTKLP